MAICEYCDFVYDQTKRTFVCQTCGYVVTDEDKRRWLERSERLMREEEAAMKETGRCEP